MQCHQGNREKKLGKLGVILLRLKLGKKASKDAIHKYLQTNDGAIKELSNFVTKLGDLIDPKYQKKRITGYAELGLWIGLNHPKIRPVTIAIINNTTNYRVDKSQLPKVKLSLIEQKLMMMCFSYTANKIAQGRYVGIRQDLMSSSNTVINALFNQINESIRNIRGLTDDEKAALIILADCALWTMSRDTAYRDAFFWSVNEVGNDIVRNLLEKHPVELVQPPEKWYPNVWLYGKKLTKEQRRKGELMPGEFSEIEQHCVPAIQEKLLKKGKGR